jgi:hypothetical protein
MTVGAVVGLLGALAAGPETAPRWVEVLLTPWGRMERVLVFGSLVRAPRLAIAPRPTCTVRALPADPHVDPGMVLDVPGDVDPGMTVPSRCAE